MTYKFFNYSSSDVIEDPVFNNKEFSLFGDPGLFDGPELYHVDKYSYALSNPEKDKNNKELMFKIATYLYHHPTSLNNKLVTYFFGELNDCQNISEGFTNQVVKIVTYEMLDEWYPKTLEEVKNVYTKEAITPYILLQKAIELVKSSAVSKKEEVVEENK